MTLKFHRSLTEEKWAVFPFSRQILMIGNELNRAQHWLEQKDPDEAGQCYERAFELLALTIAVTKRHSALRELIRFQELLAQQYLKAEAEENARLLRTLLSFDRESFATIEN